MEKYICLHGHFYQPPRENPWLESIETQDSAYPYHDWNERINAECYAPNRASRILDEKGFITEIVNNYSKISFNFGPTLLSWLEKNGVNTYKAILEADQESQKLFSGHGSALAQAYNHIIMPLANRKDKETQIIWGIQDFLYRFKRQPEGMWLPETAVDLESLEIMAEHGIKFTILAPHQAKRVRKLDGKNWKDMSGAKIDPTMPYLLRFPSGKSINLFFYDGPISRSVAFEGVLTRGDFLANRLMGAFTTERDHAQLVHIATDGETYGHHHRYGEMALSYALRYIEENKLAKITNYGEFLEKFPPTHEVEIFEDTSWSCAHGIGRWKEDCGCHISEKPNWNQKWRAPLRQALNKLRDELLPLYEKEGQAFLKNPWDARNGYIYPILDRSPQSIEVFLRTHTHQQLEPAQKIRVLKLLELSRNMLLMFTSCGWFFDDISGIETIQILRYAGRVIQLAKELFNLELKGSFISVLSEAQSNINNTNGGMIYEKFVETSKVDLVKVAAHFALSSLFKYYSEETPIYCFKVEKKDYQSIPSGKAKLAIGKIRITSLITHESEDLQFGVIHVGDHNITGGIRHFQNELEYQTFIKELVLAFEKSDLAAFFRTIDQYFGLDTYSLKALFQDEQRQILNIVLESTVHEAVEVYKHIYEHHAPLMHFLSDLSMPLPKPFYNAADFTLNTNLREAFEENELNFDQIKSIFDEVKRLKVTIDQDGISFGIKKTLNRLAEQFSFYDTDVSFLKTLDTLLALIKPLPFPVDFWKLQNIFFELTKSTLPRQKEKAETGDSKATEWLDVFKRIGEKLRVKV